MTDFGRASFEPVPAVVPLVEAFRAWWTVGAVGWFLKNLEVEIR